GFEGIEKTLAGDGKAGTFCHGDTPGLADACLVPQVFNARRFKIDMGKYPKISAVDAACLKLPAFDKARPENQPDAE
ncbi:MAG: maleylacetoacetate isomerase, partial [Hyphomicrobiales bacterium]|nr:maleylacetoacetate isomerase [Hyphomicrobiales bacterium]